MFIQQTRSAFIKRRATISIDSEQIQEAFKDRILIPKNNLDYVPKK